MALTVHHTHKRLTIMKNAGDESIAERTQMRGMIFLMLPRVQMYRDLIGCTIAIYLKQEKKQVNTNTCVWSKGQEPANLELTKSQNVQRIF